MNETLLASGGFSGFLLMLLAILFGLYMLVMYRATRQKYFSLSRLLNAMKHGVANNRHERNYHMDSDIFKLDHILSEHHCFVTLTVNNEHHAYEYYVMSVRDGEVRSYTTSMILKSYLGLPGWREGLQISVKDGRIKGMYNVIDKNKKEGISTRNAFPAIAKLVNNTIRKKCEVEKPFLSFENDGTPIVSIMLPYYRYERYYINGEISTEIDRKICALHQFVMEVDREFKPYIEAKKRKYPNLLNVVIPVASAFLFGMAIPNLFDFDGDISGDIDSTDGLDVSDDATASMIDDNEAVADDGFVDESVVASDDIDNASDDTPHHVPHHFARNAATNNQTQCPTCYGSGTCWMCGGKGWKKYEMSLGNYEVFECSECHGSGRCHDCNGRGTIFV